MGRKRDELENIVLKLHENENKRPRRALSYILLDKMILTRLQEKTT